MVQEVKEVSGRLKYGTIYSSCDCIGWSFVKEEGNLFLKEFCFILSS